MLLFLSEKKIQNLLDTYIYIYKNSVLSNWVKYNIRCLLLIFKVVYWDCLTELLPFACDFVAKGQQLVWGQVG